MVFAVTLVFAALAQSLGAAAENDDESVLRHLMVEHIAEEAKLTAKATGVDTISQNVLDALEAVPRHLFVPTFLQQFAYAPHPLPIHPEQNLAAPFLVALMTELAQIQPQDRVYETGTGSGYHAAVMAAMGAEVYSVEIIPELADQASNILAQNYIRNVHIREGDGYFGWPEQAPFDVILIKEAVNHIPSPLLAQLGPGGRVVAPIGSLEGPQYLTVLSRRPDGSYKERRYLPVRFSPLQGGERI